jgi:hypothetical protein
MRRGCISKLESQPEPSIVESMKSKLDPDTANKVIANKNEVEDFFKPLVAKFKQESHEFIENNHKQVDLKEEMQEELISKVDEIEERSEKLIRNCSADQVSKVKADMDDLLSDLGLDLEEPLPTAKATV